MLYGLIHLRYILTSRGMAAMARSLSLSLPAPPAPPPLAQLKELAKKRLLFKSLRPPFFFGAHPLQLFFSCARNAAGEVQKRRVRPLPARLLRGPALPARGPVGHPAHGDGEAVLRALRGEKIINNKIRNEMYWTLGRFLRCRCTRLPSHPLTDPPPPPATKTKKRNRTCFTRAPSTRATSTRPTLALPSHTSSS